MGHFKKEAIISIIISFCQGYHRRHFNYLTRICYYAINGVENAINMVKSGLK